jgi:acyl-CoA dehydrogenase
VIDFSPTDEQMAIQDTVRRFVRKELLPYEQLLIERDISGGNPNLTVEEIKSLRAKAKAAGLWGVDTPDEYGGVDLPWSTQVLINIELGRSFARFKFGGSAPDVLYLVNSDLKRRYLVPTINDEKTSCFMLSEPGVGSDVHNLRTTAVRYGDEWVINGEKTWISYADEADYGLVFCRTPGDEGLTLFIVDREAGWKASPIATMGSHAPCTVVFQDVRVPDANRVSEVGDGFKLAMQFIYRNRSVLVPARAIGGCERLLGMGIEYAKNRVTMGEPLAERENIRFMIAESEVELRALKLLTLHAAWTGESGRDPRHSASITKFSSGTIANRIVDRVLQIHGAIGYSKELPVERWYRDFRVERIYEGSDEMNLLTVSRNLLKGNNAVGEIW